MASKKQRKHALLICESSYMRTILQNYLHSILGEYIAFDTASTSTIYNEDQLKGYQCILFSGKAVKTNFTVIIPDDIKQLVCARVFDHAYLDQIIRIPPGEKVYLVNDTFKNANDVIMEFRECGIDQYEFIPWASGSTSPDPNIHYAITIGEPQLVPNHIANVINTGNRIIDISTINELCYHFQLPPELLNQITKNYISHILKLTKTAIDYNKRNIYNHQLLQVVSAKLPISFCILADGNILMANHNFADDFGFSEVQDIGKPFVGFLPARYSGLAFDQPADYKLHNRSGMPFVVSTSDVAVPYSDSLCLLVSHYDSTGQFLVSPDTSVTDETISRGLDSVFPNANVLSASYKSILSRVRQLSLSDFPVLIQGEVGTQKKQLAHLIHQNSRRHDQPFVVFNQRYSLHRQSMSDILSSANHGTLLIDHIEYLPLEHQDMLIQLINSNSSDLNSLYGNSEYDIRIIATSGLNLYDRIREGAFREALFYIFGAASINTIPLRTHPDDIPIILAHLLQNRYHDLKVSPDTILSDELYRFLMSYDYPGNFQELSNLVNHFHACYAAKPLTLGDLPPYVRASVQAVPAHLPSESELAVMAVISENPRSGRTSILSRLEAKGIHMTDGSLRSLLKQLSENQLILVHKTKGGCEITAKGREVLTGSH